MNVMDDGAKGSLQGMPLQIIKIKWQVTMQKGSRYWMQHSILISPKNFY